MTLQEKAARLERAFPAILKDETQRLPLILSTYIEGHMDARGPAKGERSTSDQIGLQRGRISRGLIPGQTENIADVTVTGGRVVLVYGTAVPYHEFHEDGTADMMARPSFAPGVEDFEREEWPAYGERVVDRVAREWND